MFLFIFFAKYIFGLSYELFKIEVPEITQIWDWTKCFLHNNHLVIKSQIQLIRIKKQIYKIHN